MRIAALGPLTAYVALGEPELAPALRQVLAVLVTGHHRGLTQEQIADEVWGDDLPASWESSFRNSIGRLRGILGKAAIVSRSGKYALGKSTTVDVWELLDLANTERPVDERLFTMLLSGTPFAGVEHSPRIRAMSGQITDARTSLIKGLLEGEFARSLTQRELRAVQQHQRANLFDEYLLEIAVEVCRTSGASMQALSMVDEARKALAADSLDLPKRVKALEDEIRGERGLPAHQGFDLNDADGAQRIPHVLERALRTPMVDRGAQVAQVLSALADSGAITIGGQSGVGKTRLLAAVTEAQAAKGTEVLYACAQRVGDAAYAPLVAVLPGAAEEIQRVQSEVSDPKLAQTLVCAALAEGLSSMRSRRVCLIVDDAHLLDSSTEAAVAYLARLALDRKFQLLIAGRSDTESDSWSNFAASLDAAGAATLELRPLTLDGLAEIARLMYRTVPNRLCVRLAQEVLALTGGRPGPARYLMDRADPETLLLDTMLDVSGDSVFTGYVGRMDRSVRETATAAAVIGYAFDLGLVAQLVKQTEDDVVDHCETLIDLGFIEESSVPDRFFFVHTLHHGAVLESASAARLRRLHRSAAEIATSALQRARHLMSAVPLVAPTDAAVALLRSADELFAEGVFRESASAYRDANRLHAESMTADHLNRFAAALDLSGADGALIREQSFEISVGNDDWSGALAAAISGLPHAEPAHGDRRRVDLLERIPSALLNEADRRLLHSTLTRQLLFLGDDLRSRPGVTAMGDSSETPEGVLQSFIDSALIGVLPGPRGELELPPEIDSVDDPVLRLRALQMASLNALERSDNSRIIEILERLEQATVKTDDPLRNWHHMILASTVEFVGSNFDLADQLSRQALALGLNIGVGEAESARLAQIFVRGWVRHSYEDLPVSAEEIERAGSNEINRVMAALMSAAEGDDGRLRTFIERLDTELMQSSAVLAVPALVLLAKSIGDFADANTKATVVALLSHRSGTSALLANGVIHAGPVDLALAELAEDQATREYHLAVAAAVAKRQGSVLWARVCELELASGSREIDFRDHMKLTAEQGLPPRVAER